MFQLSPSQALTVNEGYSFSQEDPIKLGIPVTRHFDNGKTRPAKPPAVPTNSDRSCTYLVLRAHRMSQTSGWHRPWLPRGRRTSLGSDQHLDKHWPEGAGAKINMTLGLADPRERIGGGEANGKTKVGPCWRSFIQSELSRGPINHPTA